jgi:hypothetical protein
VKYARKHSPVKSIFWIMYDSILANRLICVLIVKNSLLERLVHSFLKFKWLKFNSKYF